MSTTDATITPWTPELTRHSRMKILVIDDEPANVALLEDLLLEAGCTRVHTLSDSRKALETCTAFEPDLILLDLMMPHVDGFTILEALRSLPTDVFLPVVILTADVNEETKRRALRAGATDFLLKPFDHIEVLLRITNLLEMRRLHLQLDTQRAAFEEALRDRSLELRELQAQSGYASV
ncbi:MAG TPA: response regulator [Chthoniobacterales bacterium]